jgi:hypothetical protein
MQGSSYFRQRANTCFRLSTSCTDQRLANHFRALAEEFMAKAAHADIEDESERLPFPHIVSRKPDRAN